jgi:hypothetical protein
MLAFLDALCVALLARNAAATRELLEHPLASTLPEVVLQEARRVVLGESAPLEAPLHALRLYHQTAHLLGVRTDPASRASEAAPPALRGERARQMELPLHVRVA